MEHENEKIDVIWVRAPKGTKTKWVRRAIQSGGNLSAYVGRAVNAYEAMKSVLEELEESVDYWSEYDVPVGIQDRIKYALALARKQ